MPFIKYEKSESTAIIKLSKPSALNALSSEVLRELDQALNEVENDKDIRCLVITGDGEKAFVAGADIKEIHSLNTDTAQDFAGFGQSLFTRIERFHVPVIAAVNGFALGGGLELALCCDFIFASTKAKLGLPECTLGLMPGFGGTVRLARKVGTARAKQMTYTGDMVCAEEAKEFGLVNEVFEASELMTGVLRVAKTISLRAPLALTAIKKTIDVTYGLQTDEAMIVERKAFGELFESEDVKEGTQAFLDKRKPQFTGQ